MTISINVARNKDEAERQARGEDVTVRREAADQTEEGDEAIAPGEFFEQPATIAAAGEDHGVGAEKAG